jgi:hypothetical protein
MRFRYDYGNKKPQSNNVSVENYKERHRQKVLAQRNKIAEKIFIEIATMKINQNNYHTWSEVAKRCLEISTSFVMAKEKLKDANE